MTALLILAALAIVAEFIASPAPIPGMRRVPSLADYVAHLQETRQ